MTFELYLIRLIASSKYQTQIQTQQNANKSCKKPCSILVLIMNEAISSIEKWNNANEIICITDTWQYTAYLK